MRHLIPLSFRLDEPVDIVRQRKSGAARRIFTKKGGVVFFCTVPRRTIISILQHAALVIRQRARRALAG
ncbi:hypothetical protein SE16_01200 [Ardenticatena maritima]|uniref:Uncharacterized protein n=1 Tax=Ardenticatena maritima TaxID=872965 RepID=A0A0P6YBT9_9CHLR|nr:hypothetical protein SE16_01200 [Ardenticatena maritima]